MKEYFFLQYKMISRKLEDAGIHPLLALLFLTISFIGIALSLDAKTEYASYILVLLACFVLSNLSETKRNDFLKTCFDEKNFKKTRMMENMICSLPFLFFLVYKMQFLAIVLLLILVIFFALVNFNTNFHYTIWTPFYKKPFEFVIGFRNTFWIIFLAYILTVISVFYQNFSLGIFALILVFLCVLGYYTKPENELFVWNFALTPQNFLIEKMKTAFVFTLGLSAPLMIILSLFNHENIHIILLIFFIAIIYLSAVILCKYHSFPDEISIPKGILLAMSILLPPLLLFLIPYFYIRSQKQLQRFL